MAINTSDNTSGFEDVIANNLPSRAFRYTAENKNVLSTPGAMYVGTGIKRKSQMSLGSGDPLVYDSYITAVLEVAEADGYSLQIKQVELKYANGTTSVYVDDNNYITSSGGTVVKKWFPCWVKGTSVISPHLLINPPF